MKLGNARYTVIILNGFDFSVCIILVGLVESSAVGDHDMRMLWCKKSIIDC